MFRFENNAKKCGYQTIIGVDEAGRGPLAGPVVAAAVCLREKTFQHKIDDSKRLNPCRREKAFCEILDKAYVGVGVINEAIIDRVNILRATFLAMSMAVGNLIVKLPDSQTQHRDFQKRVCLLIDGSSFQTELPYDHRTIISGDQLSTSIACASIVAKVIRDRFLDSYDQIFPQYGFKHHKGYPTRAHKEAIQKYGLSFIHRRTFRYSLKP